MSWDVPGSEKFWDFWDFSLWQAKSPSEKSQKSHVMVWPEYILVRTKFIPVCTQYVHVHTCFYLIASVNTEPYFTGFRGISRDANMLVPDVQQPPADLDIDSGDYENPCPEDIVRVYTCMYCVQPSAYRYVLSTYSDIFVMLRLVREIALVLYAWIPTF
jgi:hypothetical protein